MIRRAFVYSLFLFAGYNLCLVFLPIHNRFGMQSQWQENLVKAQEFILRSHPAPIVVVGSSLAARLHEDFLGNEFNNLAFSGGSAFTGLELILRGPETPKVVLIESNIILKGKNDAVLNNVFRPVIGWLRIYLPALRERYEPAALIAGKLIAQPLSFGARWAESKIGSPPQAQLNEAIFSKLLIDQNAAYHLRPDPQTLSERIYDLRKKVADLEARGVRVVFLEMPIDLSLANLPYPAEIRSDLQNAFPVSRYLWICPKEGRNYSTTDGLHLTGDEPREYALELRRNLERARILPLPISR